MEYSMKQFHHLEIELEEIKLSTNNFNRENLIGVGGFGRVYRGPLLHFKEKSLVAFKRLDRTQGQGDAEFLKEITYLYRYKHENLISLLGYCIQERENILVYDYAFLGSLDRHLTSAGLGWTQRLKICLGAAKGLNYLHDPRGTNQRLIHCDVKSANILLDDKWNAKVADFGLSKIGPTNMSVLVTNALGTPGYCDPMFLKTYTLTNESDVYSFGVVLFEVMCGRSCSRRKNDGELEVLVGMWKKRYEEKKLLEIIFPDLIQNMDPTSLEIFSDIAFQCLKRSRAERPQMSLVVEKLQMALRCQEEFLVNNSGEVKHRVVGKMQPMSSDLNSDRYWKQKLPNNYEDIIKLSDDRLQWTTKKDLYLILSKGLLINNGREWFSLDDNGKHCELISINECLIGQDHNDRYSMQYHSRFPVGALSEFKKKLKIRVRAQFLSPDTTYTVNLVIKLKDIEIQPKQDKSEDDWMMLELCEFTSQGTTADLEIFTRRHTNSYVIEGIEFLPVKKEEHQALEDENVGDKRRPKSLDSDKYWEPKLPNDYQDIIKWSKDSLQWTTKKELHLILSKGFLFNNDRFKWFPFYKSQQWFSIDKNGKKCLTLSARGTCEAEGAGSRWKPLPKSRFGEAMEMRSCRFKSVSDVTCQLLSPQTTYATYLIYTLPANLSTLRKPLYVNHGTEFLDPAESFYPWYVYLVSPGVSVFDVTKKAHLKERKSPNFKGIPQQRSDGWMEVRVWEFQTTTSEETIHMGLTFANWSDPYDYKGLRGLCIQGIEFRPI